MRVLYLYMFPLWGNGSGAWLRRQIIKLKQRQQDNFHAAIVSPERRRFTRAKMYRVKPKEMGVFVGNPELIGSRKLADWTPKEHVENYATYLCKSAEAIEDFKPDLIHVFHSAWLPRVGETLSQLYKIPTILTTHGSDLYYLEEDSRWISSIREASVQSKYITANSTFTRQFYLKMFGKDLDKKMRTIPAGVSHNIKTKRNTSWIDKEFKPINGKIVLFTGRLIEHKGVEYLIKAAPKIDATICILGSGPDKDRLVTILQETKATNVRMVPFYTRGELKKIYDFYKRADVYIAPSVWKEPLGMVILESMIFGTPVVSTDQGGAAQIIQNGENGLLIRPRSASAIAEAVNTLLNDDALREKMGKAGRKRVKTMYSWNKVADEFYHVYKQAIKK